MEEQILTVTLDSCWANPDLVQNFILKIKKNNVEASFHSDENNNSFWTLKGVKDVLVKVINDHWLMHGFYAPEDVMNEETMNLLGFKKSEE